MCGHEQSGRSSATPHQNGEHQCRWIRQVLAIAKLSQRDVQLQAQANTLSLRNVQLLGAWTLANGIAQDQARPTATRFVVQLQSAIARIVKARGDPVTATIYTQILFIYSLQVFFR